MKLQMKFILQPMNAHLKRWNKIMKAFDEGYKAFIHNVEYNDYLDNPNDDKEEHSQWNDGYEKAYQDYKDRILNISVLAY